MTVHYPHRMILDKCNVSKEYHYDIREIILFLGSQS